MFLYKNNQKGATMLETLGVLTIVVILGVSSIKLIGSIFSMFKQSMVSNEIRDLQQAISGRYKFEGNYKEIFEGKNPLTEQNKIAEFLCNEKLVPNQMCGGDVLYHRMGGRVWILPEVKNDGTLETDNYDKYTVEFLGLTDRACLNIAQINWNTQKKTNIYSMIINENNNAYKVKFTVPINIDGGSKGFPASINDIMKSCSYDDNNSIRWVFY